MLLECKKCFLSSVSGLYFTFGCLKELLSSRSTGTQTATENLCYGIHILFLFNLKKGNFLLDNFCKKSLTILFDV